MMDSLHFASRGENEMDRNNAQCLLRVHVTCYILSATLASCHVIFTTSRDTVWPSCYPGAIWSSERSGGLLRLWDDWWRAGVSPCCALPFPPQLPSDPLFLS